MPYTIQDLDRRRKVLDIMAEKLIAGLQIQKPVELLQVRPEPLQ